jgi:RNA polymerase sigma factor (sigma-70 family)
MSAMSRAEDGLSAAEALALHEGFVRSRALRWVGSLPHLEKHFDDLMQEGRIGLWEALRCFDASRGVVLLTFAGKVVDRRMMRFVNRWSNLVRFERGQTPVIICMDAPMESDERNRLDALMASPTAEHEWEGDDRHARVMRAVSRLREVERRVVEEVILKGRTQREVSVEMGCSHTWVQQLLEKAMKSLRRAMHVRMETDECEDGWVPMKQWLADEAAKLNVSPQAVRVAMYRGTRPMPETKRIKGRYFVRGAGILNIEQGTSNDEGGRES